MHTDTIHGCLAMVVLTLALGSAGCSAPPEPSNVNNRGDNLYDRSLALARAGDEQAAIESLRAALDADPEAVQRALLEPLFLSTGLRDTREFRRAVHDAAVKHRVSEVTMVGEDEPGERIEVQVTVVGPDEKPLAGAVVYIFATDDKGLYHPTIEGEQTPRIFGTIVMNEEGQGVFRTIRAGPYPGTRNPRHIHMDVRSGDLRLAVPHYAVFDDDPLLFEPQNAEPREEAVRIRMQREKRDGIVRGSLLLPLR